ncbi:hypothetical protein ABN034_09320 [Actinopolymorpha sp. B11F2]
MKGAHRGGLDPAKVAGAAAVVTFCAAAWALVILAAVNVWRTLFE